jgi:hypothetical protein
LIGSPLREFAVIKLVKAMHRPQKLNEVKDALVAIA